MGFHAPTPTVVRTVQRRSITNSFSFSTVRTAGKQFFTLAHLAWQAFVAKSKMSILRLTSWRFPPKKLHFPSSAFQFSSSRRNVNWTTHFLPLSVIFLRIFPRITLLSLILAESVDGRRFLHVFPQSEIRERDEWPSVSSSLLRSLLFLQSPPEYSSPRSSSRLVKSPGEIYSLAKCEEPRRMARARWISSTAPRRFLVAQTDWNRTFVEASYAKSLSIRPKRPFQNFPIPPLTPVQLIFHTILPPFCTTNVRKANCPKIKSFSFSRNCQSCAPFPLLFSSDPKLLPTSDAAFPNYNNEVQQPTCCWLGLGEKGKVFSPFSGQSKVGWGFRRAFV